MNMPTVVEYLCVFFFFCEITLAQQQPSSQQPHIQRRAAKFKSLPLPMALQSESKDTLLLQQAVRHTKTSGKRV